MNESNVMSRLETLLTEAVLTGQASRNFWINGCQQPQSITRMDISDPMLMFPIVGCKRVVTDQEVYSTVPGELILLPKGTRCDVENIPAPERSRFLGASLVFDLQTLELFGKIYAEALQDWELSPKWKAKGSKEAFSLIAEWISHDQNFTADAIQTRHRLVEILLVLARQGKAGNLLVSRSETLSERIKKHIKTDLSRDWSLKDLTKTLAMSERTLRRRLQDEETGFRDVLEDTRLNQGVQRVISSDMPIGQIAYECGYQSQSRFAERFRKRFSMSPTELRATQRQPSGEVISLEQLRARN